MTTLKKLIIKMAAATEFWNHRGVLNVCPAGSNISACRENIDTGVVVETVSRLTVIHRKLKHPQLWSEAAIVKALIYKYGNQHRKEKYFQGLKKVVKCLIRLQEVGIFDKVADVKDKFPRLSKRGTLVVETLSNYPSIESIISLLGYLTGVAQLLLQIMSLCQETFQYSCAQMAFGYFLTFHVACSSSLSRIWVLTRSFLQDIAECYDIIFPWMNYPLDSHQVGKSDLHYSESNDLPRSLKAWLHALKPEQPNKNRNSLTLFTKAFTPGTLDKLFASTPRQRPEGIRQQSVSSPRPSCDLGESLTSDEVKSSVENSEVLTSNESLILRRQLFAIKSEITGKLQTLFEDCSTKGDITNTIRRKTGTNDTFSLASNKKLRADTKAHFKRGPGRFLYGKKIHIYSNKRWKLCMEIKRQRKLMKSSQGKKRDTEDSNLRQKSPFTQWMCGVQSKIGDTSGETVKRTCNGFVQHKMSSLFHKFKHNSLNLDSCYKQPELLQTQRLEETSKKEDYEDEIDSIFNALDN